MENLAMGIAYILTIIPIGWWLFVLFRVMWTTIPITIFGKKIETRKGIALVAILLIIKNIVILANVKIIRGIASELINYWHNMQLFWTELVRELSNLNQPWFGLSPGLCFPGVFLGLFCHTLSTRAYIYVYKNFILLCSRFAMKLQDYFHHQKHTFLTDSEKFSLYQQIVAKRDTKKSILQRYAFAKRIAYASFVALFFMIAYGIHFFGDDLRYMTNSLIVQRGGDTVQAGYIAQIVHFDGGFFIEHEGKPLQTSLIRDGDIVTLKASTEMTFHIDDQTKAKLIGPAQFMLHVDGQGDAQEYTLQLIYGDFVEMESLNAQTTQNIAIIAKDITVHQEKANTASHFQIIKDGDTQRISNKGAQILITRTDDGTVKTTVDDKHTLAIAANDITLIDDETQITRVLTQKDASQTIAFVDVEDKTQAENEINTVSLADVLEKGDVQVDERVETAVDTMIASAKGQGKNIPTADQDEQLRNSLYASFLSKDAQSLLSAYVAGDEDAAMKYSNVLEDNLLSIAKSFNITGVKKSGSTLAHRLQNIATISSELNMKLDAQYYIPPRYTSNIQIIGNLSQYILSQDFGSKTDSEIQLPSNLRFQ